MNPKANPGDERSAVPLPFMPIAPHPPLHRYYGEGDARQPFLNDLFNRTAWQLITRAGVQVYARMPLLSFFASR